MPVVHQRVIGLGMEGPPDGSGRCQSAREGVSCTIMASELQVLGAQASSLWRPSF
jgi:hypothetical protein